MTQPQAQRQQHHQAQPMGQLQSMLNIILREVGNVMGDPNKRRDPSARGQLALIPQASHRFHETLDKLEDDLARARAVMRRDLGILQLEREKREREEAEAREQAAKRDANGAAGAAAGNMAMPKTARGEDVVMVDEPPAPAEPSTNSQPEAVFNAPIAPMKAAEPAPENHIPLAAGQAQPAASEASALPASDSVEEMTATLPAPSDGIFNADGTAPASQGDFDFDSMFAYTDDPADAAQAMGGGEDLTNPDVNSLLPGLESYATMLEGGDTDNTVTHVADGPSLENTDELDFDTLDIPAAPIAEQQSEGGEQANQHSQQQAASAIVNDADVALGFDITSLTAGGEATDGDGGGQDTAFDDLFNYYPYGGSGDGAGGEENDNADDLFAFLNS